jgi:hypothetical protein
MIPNFLGMYNNILGEKCTKKINLICGFLKYEDYILLSFLVINFKKKLHDNLLHLNAHKKVASRLA